MSEPVHSSEELFISEESLMAPSKIEPVNPWKEAVVDALVCDFLLNETNKDDPRRAIRDIVNWNLELGRDMQPPLSDAAIETAFHQHATCVAGRAHVDLAGFIEAVRSLRL